MNKNALLIWLLAVASPLAAEGAPPVVVRAEVAAAATDSTVVLWTFELADGWHLYGPHRNDTGQPPTVQFELPDGWSASGLRGWPWPQRHVVADLILDHIYEERLVLWQAVRHPGGGTADHLRAQLRWLVCSDLCVPGDTTLTVAVPGPIDPTAAATLTDLRSARPGPLPPGLVTVSHRPDGIELRVAGARRLAFVPDAAGPGLTDLLHDGVADADRLFLQMPTLPTPDNPLTGLLSIDHNSTISAGSINLTLPNRGE
jgi:thiol:disulfide interchange protein DsbD